MSLTLTGNGAVQQPLAFFQLGALDEFVGLVSLLDASRSADYCRPACLLELPSFGAEGYRDRSGRVASSREQQALCISALLGFERWCLRLQQRANDTMLALL